MEQWRHIRHNNSQLPPLLLKASFSKEGYIVRLTDLSHVWSETLGRKQIIDRAKRQSCSIDPSEDEEQLRIFLDNIRSALKQDIKTSLAIASTKDGNVKLNLETPLPAPLPVFEWEIHLTQSSSGNIKNELVSPLIHRAHQLNHNLGLLIAELQAKDKIIAKITDRLETSGHDLTAVFPGVSGVKLSRKKTQQEQLARHVRGLGNFDEDAFRERMAAGGDDGAAASSELSDAIFASLPKEASVEESDQTSTDWWRQIPPGEYIDLVGDTAEHDDKSHGDFKNSGGSQERRESADEAQDDGFQRQATPPNLRNEPQHVRPDSNDDMDIDDNVPPQQDHQPRAQQTIDDESTDDEDDLDGPIQRPKPPPESTSPNNAQPARKPTPKSPSPPPAPKPSTHGPFTHEEETDTEGSDGDLDKPSQPSQKPTSQLPSRQRTQTPQPAAPSPRKKPGTLGGRARTTEPTSSPPPTNETPEPEPEQVPAPKPKSKLGTLGGKKQLPQPQEPPSNAPSKSPSPKPANKKLGAIGGKRAASPSNNIAEPQNLEQNSSAVGSKKQENQTSLPAAKEATDDEKADAKREALRKELEAKAKAPVKKKRKF